MGKGILSRLITGKNKNKLCGDTSQLAERILSNQLSDIKKAAALVCLKHNKSPKLYRKIFQVLDGLNKIRVKYTDSIEVSYPYKRKRFSPYLLIPASIVLSLLPDSSVKTVFHGENLPVATTKDVFDYLDISAISIEDSLGMLKNLNLAFFNTKLFLPELSKINHLRLELNMNDVFTILERFLNPVGSWFGIAAVRNERELGFTEHLLQGRYRRYVVVVEREPFPDILNSTTVFLYGDRKETVYIDFEKYGWKHFLYRNFGLEEHIDFIKKLLSKELPEYEHLLFINGALLLYLKERVKTIDEGVEITRELFKKYDYSQILRNIQRYTDYLNYKNIYEL